MTGLLHRTAIVYDFDGTLSPGSMQQHNLLPEMGYADADIFWQEVKALNREIDGDEILTYMHLLQQKEGDHMSKERLASHGACLPYFAGVDDWFPGLASTGKQEALN